MQRYKFGTPCLTCKFVHFIYIINIWAHIFIIEEAGGRFPSWHQFAMINMYAESVSVSHYRIFTHFHNARCAERRKYGNTLWQHKNMYRPYTHTQKEANIKNKNVILAYYDIANVVWKLSNIFWNTMMANMCNLWRNTDKMKRQWEEEKNKNWTALCDN